MAVRITTSRDFTALGIELIEDDMRDVGDLLVRRIRTRTEAGVDHSGAPFRPYSDGYAEQKLKYLGHSRVDLTVSGRMLNDMQVTSVTRNTATISFISQGGGAGGGTFIQRSASLGAADKAAFNDPSRQFFDASDEDEQMIVDALDHVLTERFNQE